MSILTHLHNIRNSSQLRAYLVPDTEAIMVIWKESRACYKWAVATDHDGNFVKEGENTQLPVAEVNADMALEALLHIKGPLQKVLFFGSDFMNIEEIAEVIKGLR